MRRLNGPYTDNVLALYPASDTGTVHSAMNRFVTDMFFVAGSRYFARTTSKINSNTYAYHFTHISADPKRRMLGAFHASEIPYVFMTQDTGFSVYDDKDHELSRVMSAYWVQFARTGDPNGAGRPAWPKYDAASDKHLEFDGTIAGKSGLHKDAADLFERIALEKHAKRQNTGER